MDLVPSEAMARQRPQSIFRWHLSSIAFALCAIAFFSLIELPGQTCDEYYFRDFYLQEHGWPFVHLRRLVQRPSTSDEELPKVRDYLNKIAASDLNTPADPKPGTAFWSDLRNWRVFSENAVWYRWSCIANLSICAATCFVIGGLLEWRRRRRKSVLQFSLAEVFFAFSLTGVAVASYRFAVERVKREAIARQATLDGLLMDFECRDLSPGWLSRLSDNSRYLQVQLDNGVSVPIGWRAVEITIRDGAVSFQGQPSPLEMAKSLEELHAVTVISHWPGGSETIKILNYYPPAKIKELNFRSSRCTDYRSVSRFTNVESLTFRGVDLESVKFNFPQLPKLKKFCLDEYEFSERTIEWLQSLPELKEVCPWSTGQLDKELTAKLKSSLPNVELRDRLGNAIH